MLEGRSAIYGVGETPTRSASLWPPIRANAFGGPERLPRADEKPAAIRLGVNLA
jgi:hypothetical protein